MPTRAAGRRVAAFGYPLGDAVGATIKLTTGTVSAVGDEGTEGMCVLDVRVNPGNSGGPLCDVRGHVVGMVTAKSRGGYGVDSYGMAIPITPLREFLTQNLPSKAKGLFLNSKGRTMEWVDVDRLVSPSVLMIIRNR